MKAKGRTVLMCLAVLSVFAFSPVLATATEVYLEGAYDADYLDVYIYADFTVPQVISYGVRLNFLPAELTVVSASKTIFPAPYAGDPTPYTSNATVWELGSGDNRNNPDPTILADAVVFKGGIINEADPASSGVTDMERVFLGMVRFSPGTGAGGVIPAAPNLSLALAEDNGTYANFVQYVGGADPGPGVVLDLDEPPSITFRPVDVTTKPGLDIAERGDANGDGDVNITDSRIVRYYITSGEPYKVYADCTNDGAVNIADSRCVRAKITGN